MCLRKGSNVNSPVPEEGWKIGLKGKSELGLAGQLEMFGHYLFVMRDR